MFREHRACFVCPCVRYIQQLTVSTGGVLVDQELGSKSSASERERRASSFNKSGEARGARRRCDVSRTDIGARASVTSNTGPPVVFMCACGRVLRGDPGLSIGSAPVALSEGRKDLGACSAPTTSNGEILTQTQTVVVHQSLRERRTIERRVDRAQARVRHAEDRSIVRKLGLKLVREFRRSSEEKLQVITSRT